MGMHPDNTIESVALFATVLESCSLGFTLLFDETVWKHACVFVGCAHAIGYCVVPLIIDKYIHPSEVAFSLALPSLVVYFSATHHLALRQALRDLLPDWKRYDDSWCDVKESESDALKAHSLLVRCHAQQKVKQPTPDLDQLHSMGATLNEWYQSVVSDWASFLWLAYKEAPLKFWTLCGPALFVILLPK